MTPLEGVSRGVYEAALGLAWLGTSRGHSALRALTRLGVEGLWRAPRRVLAGMEMALPVVVALEEARRHFDVAEADALVSLAGLRFVPYGTPGYPAELGHLALPPAGLFVRGDHEALKSLMDVPRVTVVGTRKASAEGLRTTETFASAFCARGVAVVSGMALGIDGRAHQAALERGMLTAAVLGCGADVAYPPRHRWLYEKIARGGVVISELPPGTPPARWTFPHRNRLLAALGDAVVVIEGSLTSGAMQTANWALELGRPVFAVPGSIYAEGHQGCNTLLRDGASPALRPDLVVEDFLAQTRIDRGERRGSEPRPSSGGEPYSRGGPGNAVGARERSVLEALASGQASLDGLMAQTGLSVRELSAVVAELELDGLVERAGTGMYIRAP
jgi:DNA processing protein